MNADLGGLPLSGDLLRIARVVLESGLQTNAVPCQRSRELVNKLTTDILSTIDPVSGAGDDLPKCRAIIDAGGVPSYGVDLVDDHHGSCWRIYHIEAFAKETTKKRLHATARIPSTRCRDCRRRCAR